MPTPHLDPEYREYLSVSPIELARATDPVILRVAVEQARLALPSRPLVLIVTDARSLPGAVTWAFLSQMPKGETALRSMMSNVVRDVEAAKHETALTGKIVVHYTCGPASSFCIACGDWGEPYTSMAATLSRVDADSTTVLVVAFSGDAATIVPFEWLSRELG